MIMSSQALPGFGSHGAKVLDPSQADTQPVDILQLDIPVVKQQIFDEDRRQAAKAMHVY